MRHRISVVVQEKMIVTEWRHCNTNLCKIVKILKCRYLKENFSYVREWYT